MSKCKCKNSAPDACDVKFTPNRTEKVWCLIKDLSVQRLGAPDADKAEIDELQAVAQEIKDEVVSSIVMKLGVDKGQSVIPVDDVLSVLTTATMSIAMDFFNKNEELMGYINLPDENEAVGQPLTHENPSIYR